MSDHSTHVNKHATLPSASGMDISDKAVRDAHARILACFINDMAAHPCLPDLATLRARIEADAKEYDAVRTALGGYDDSDLASLATTLHARNKRLEAEAAADVKVIEAAGRMAYEASREHYEKSLAGARRDCLADGEQGATDE